MAGPMGLLSYLDFTYEGGRLDNKVAPTYIKLTLTETIATAVGNTIEHSTAANAAVYKVVGTSRIDGKTILEVTTDIVAADVVADLAVILADDTNITAATDVELVKALNDHILGFAAADNEGNPFSRELGEKTPDKLMGLTLFSKSVSAETFQVAAAVTREQVQDLKQFGVDAVAQVEAVLTNELTQSINQYILTKLRKLGKTNISNAMTTNGFDLILPASSALGAGGETLPSIHRRILSQMLAAANLIANRGRRGAGNFAVCGPQTATVLQSISGFVANPMANTFAQAAGAIYPLGSVAGINIYTDPTMNWADYSVTVGRKGDGNGPGLVFMPYLMAESVQTIAEGTMAPKVAVKSRFALVEAGFHPETQYVTFDIKGSWDNLLTLA